MPMCMKRTGSGYCERHQSSANGQ